MLNLVFCHNCPASADGSSSEAQLHAPPPAESTVVDVSMPRSQSLGTHGTLRLQQGTYSSTSKTKPRLNEQPSSPQLSRKEIVTNKWKRKATALSKTYVQLAQASAKVRVEMRMAFCSVRERWRGSSSYAFSFPCVCVLHAVGWP